MKIFKLLLRIFGFRYIAYGASWQMVLKNIPFTEIDNFIDAHHLDIPKYNRNNKFWQPNYHDHIIRNEKEYWQRKNYIRNNPAKRKNDKFNDKK